ISLNAKVERRHVPLSIGGRVASLDIRLAMGRYWLKLINPLPAIYSSSFIAAYGVAHPDPTDITQADVCAHLETRRLFDAAAGRAMDGGALYLHLIAKPTNHTYDCVAGVQTSDYAVLDDCAKRFMAWFQRTFSEPPGQDDAWTPSQLEYRFSASAPLPSGAEKVYVAEEYYQGRLDWYSVD